MLQSPNEANIRYRRGPLIALLGALGMFVCMFVPAVISADGCGVRPIEYALATWPHILGLFAATGALLSLLGDRSGAVLTGVALLLFDATAACGCGLYLLEHSTGAATAMFALTVLALASLPIRPWTLARALWISGLVAGVAMGWLTTVAEPAFGLHLSAASALCLCVGGAAYERRERQEVRGPELPRAAVVQSV